MASNFAFGHWDLWNPNLFFEANPPQVMVQLFTEAPFEGMKETDQISSDSSFDSQRFLTDAVAPRTQNSLTSCFTGSPS